MTRFATSAARTSIRCPCLTHPFHLFYPCPLTAPSPCPLSTILIVSPFIIFSIHVYNHVQLSATLRYHLIGAAHKLSEEESSKILEELLNLIIQICALFLSSLEFKLDNHL